MRNKLIRLLPPFLAIVLSACTSSQSSRYTGSISRAATDHVVVCHGYDCAFRDRLPVTRADAARYASIMAAGRSGPEAERKAIGRAVERFELRAAAMLGHRDTPLSQFANAGSKGEMDCIDEATNAQSLLRYLAARGLLRHHTVGENASRGFMVDGQFPHAAATISERGGGEWAVDSWEGAPGDAPAIMPLAQWRVSGDIGRELEAAF